MVPLKPGGLRAGQWYLGINRRKAVVWPTRSVVARARARPVAGLGHASPAVPAGSTSSSRDGPTGTRVVHRRPVPRRLTLLSRVFAPLVLGGSRRATPTSSRPGMAADRRPAQGGRRGLSATASKSAVGEQGRIARGTVGASRLGSLS